MAEAPGGEPVPCCSDAADTAAVEAKSDYAVSSPKKRKIAGEGEPSEKLEQRLGGILCCSVCLDLPQAAVYQCTNGHLMCAPCFTHLLADARLRDEPSTCPNCRVEISKACASRNLAVEKTVSELPSECKHCAQVFPRHSLQHHEEVACCDRQFKFSQIVVGGCVAAGRGSLLAGLVRIVSGVSWAVAGALRRTYLTSDAGASAAGAGEADTGAGRCKRRQYRRVTGCRYECIGCPWRGPWHEAGAHEAACARPARSARDVLGALDERDRRAADAHRMHQQLLDLLSYEKITFNDLQLKPYRTEEFVHKLYYETSRFTAFGHQWVVKAFVNKQQRDPTQSTQREITYQLILKSKPLLPGGGALGVQWVWLRGPWGEAGLRARVAAHAFAEDCADAPPLPLPLVDPNDANRLLSNKAIHFRLIMFLASK